MSTWHTDLAYRQNGDTDLRVVVLKEDESTWSKSSLSERLLHLVESHAWVVEEEGEVGSDLDVSRVRSRAYTDHLTCMHKVIQSLDRLCWTEATFQTPGGQLDDDAHVVLGLP